MRGSSEGVADITEFEKTPDQGALRRVVITVALLNLAYFGVEFAVGLAIGSVSLFADSIDFRRMRRSIC